MTKKDKIKFLEKLIKDLRNGFYDDWAEIYIESINDAKTDPRTLRNIAYDFLWCRREELLEELLEKEDKI